jgi:hypothetical protein
LLSVPFPCISRCYQPDGALDQNVLFLHMVNDAST